MSNTKKVFDSLKAENPLSQLGTRFLTVLNFAQFPVATTPPEVVWFGENHVKTKKRRGHRLN